jgi:hypothetical protein
MIINEVYQSVFDLGNKSQSGGYLTPSRFNRYAVFCQKEIINELAQLAGLNQRVISLCRDILKTATINVVDGIASTPSDYLIYHDANSLFYDNTERKFKEYPIDYVDTSERGERLRSKIVNPEVDYPIATETTAGLLIDPQEVSRIKLTYFYLPEDPSWVSDGGDPPVFDPDASTDFVLDSKFVNVLTYKILRYLGIEIMEGFLLQTTTDEVVKNYLGKQTN